MPTFNTHIESAQATALTVTRASGVTNYGFQVDESAASAATGLKITAKAAGSGVAMTAISSGSNADLSIDAKGSGIIKIGGTSSGNIELATGGGWVGIGSSPDSKLTVDAVVSSSFIYMLDLRHGDRLGELRMAHFRRR